jgi:hypothetical protein
LDRPYHISRRVGGSMVRSTGACLTGTCRDDPIPPGVYWISIPWEESQFTGVRKDVHWQIWLDSMRAIGWVKILQTVHHEGTYIPAGVDEPPIDWHLFQVIRQAPRWTPQTGLGLPTVAPLGIQTKEEDTIQAPDPEPPFSFWDKILPDTSAGKAVVIAAGIGLGGLFLYGITR